MASSVTSERATTLPATTGPDGRYEVKGLVEGAAQITASAPGYNAGAKAVALVPGENEHDVVLTRAGAWSMRRSSVRRTYRVSRSWM